MNALLQWGGHPVVHRLGWTLLCFLWQGAVFAGLFAIAQTGLRRSSSNARYLTGCLALALMLAAPVLTFIALGAERTVLAALAASGTQSSPASQPAPSETAGASVQDGRNGQGGQRGQDRSPFPPNPNLNLNPNLPAASALLSEKFIPGFVLAWLLGVSALSLRLLFSSLQVALWKRRGNEPPGAPWMERLDRLKAALQISRPVRLVKSALVEVPAVVGWLRPVILLPAATLAGLTPAQLEAILAHELAHIRRHDYLVNLLQNALESLLFYHPAVWWVSSCVRAEREICCDEIAVRVCGDRVVYAKALAALEQLRSGRRALALGADGSTLLERIRRLSGAPSAGSLPARRRAGGALVAALVAILFISLLHHPSSNAKAQQTAPAAPNQTNVQTSIPPNPPAPLNGTVLLPNGEPAAGAELVLQVTNDLLFLDVAKGFLTENGMTNRPADGARPMSAFAIADAGGHFHFPPTEYAARLLAIHPQGFIWMPSGALEGEVAIRLEPLGQVEGTFRFGNRTGSNQEIVLNADESRLHLFTEPLTTKTDSEGRFVFTNLPAIRFALTRMFRMDTPGANPAKNIPNTVIAPSRSGFGVVMPSRSWGMSIEQARVLVKGGVTTEVELGGTGRPVVGKAAKAGMAFDWSQTHVRLDQQGLPKPEFQRYVARIVDDGTFQLENVRAGNYDLAIYVSPDDGQSNVLYLGGSFSVLTRHVVVPEMAGGRSLEASDLGSLEIQHPRAERRIKVGEQAPPIPASNMVQGFGGGPLNPTDDPGKYVLLDLCGNYFDSDLPFLRAAHDAFATDSRLVMKSVTLGYILNDEFRFGLTSETEPWSHAYTGPIQTADWAEAYGLLDQDKMVRQIVLIGPDGKILAKDLHGDGIKAAVAKELEANPDPKGQTAPPLVPPSSKTNAGEILPAATNQTSHATVGGSGRSIIGKLLLPPTVAKDDRQGIFVSLDGGVVHLPMAQVASDGTFRLDHVPAGTWGFLVHVYGPTNLVCTAGRTILIPEMPGGQNDESLDLGMVEVVLLKVHSPQIGEVLPLFELKTTDGRTFKLADHRGQYVLLDFEPLISFNETDSVEAAWVVFGTNNRLAALTIMVQPLSLYQIGGNRWEFPWPQTSLAELPWSAQYPLRASLGLPLDDHYDPWPNLPGVLLVGPDGRIVARDLHGDAIKGAVAKELEANPDSKGQTAPPLVPPSGKTNAGEVPPTSSIRTNASAGISSPQSPVRGSTELAEVNPQPVNSSMPAANPLGISLEIRCTNTDLKVGDEIPIQFIISNHGTADYKYVNRSYDRSGRMPEYKLIAKTASGESVPNPRLRFNGIDGGGLGGPSLDFHGQEFA